MSKRALGGPPWAINRSHMPAASEENLQAPALPCGAAKPHRTRRRVGGDEHAHNESDDENDSATVGLCERPGEQNSAGDGENEDDRQQRRAARATDEAAVSPPRERRPQRPQTPVQKCGSCHKGHAPLEFNCLKPITILPTGQTWNPG